MPRAIAPHPDFCREKGCAGSAESLTCHVCMLHEAYLYSRFCTDNMPCHCPMQPWLECRMLYEHTHRLFWDPCSNLLAGPVIVFSPQIPTTSPLLWISALTRPGFPLLPPSTSCFEALCCSLTFLRMKEQVPNTKLPLQSWKPIEKPLSVRQEYAGRRVGCMGLSQKKGTPLNPCLEGRYVKTHCSGSLRTI